MSGPADTGPGAGRIADEELDWPVADSRRLFDGHYLSLREDDVIGPDGDRLRRQVVEHHGAVGALVIDDDDRVLFLAQYRHPVGRRLLGLPAGILDVPGESPLEAAQRELAEETDLRAASWEPLVPRGHASPGYSAEQWSVYRAWDLSPVPEQERTVRHGEEADMRRAWIPLGAAIDAVLDGRIGDAMTMVSLLAEHARRTR